MIKKIWADPVWSKVISVGIIGLISFSYAKLTSITKNITFSEALKEFYLIKVPFLYIITGAFLYFIFKKILSKKKSFYSKKREQLRKLNKTIDPNTGLQFTWEVYFDGNTPFISNLTAFCTKHGNPPIRFIGNRCPIQGCTNAVQSIDKFAIKNFIESDLIDNWAKLNNSN